ncbi:MAG: M55 family metallopeptidase [Desulfofustis sp.]|nr:M55 family metallopeptidase [Desulfofustis sp.]
MKIYISVDLEGICGTSHWDEVTRGNERYPEFQKQMTAEVVAACRGAFGAGAEEIWIRDGHDSAKNIIGSELPENTRLIRGWSHHPYMMMQELDSSFTAAIMIGYHARGGSDGNPLAHTMSSKVALLTINGRPASEFLINYYTALYEKVPVIFVSGDKELCDHAAEIVPGIGRVAVKFGSGDSTVNLHPDSVCEQIREGVNRSLAGDLSAFLQSLPQRFEVEISYSSSLDAYKNAFFPGAELVTPQTVRFEAGDYFEVLKFFLFTL